MDCFSQCSIMVSYTGAYLRLSERDVLGRIREMNTTCHTCSVTSTDMCLQSLSMEALSSDFGRESPHLLISGQGGQPRKWSLPLSPPLCFCFQAVIYSCGARVGFFQGDIRLLPDDMKALKPTVFPTVPRLLNRIYDKVLTSLPLVLS